MRPSPTGRSSLTYGTCGRRGPDVKTGAQGRSHGIAERSTDVWHRRVTPTRGSSPRAETPSARMAAATATRC
eukprot:scaffold3443_cov404-Prasinococcus_capsulatus_cf.AAC.7